jgi:excisionase family DNA binding protein
VRASDTILSVPESSLLSVQEAAEVLGVGPAAVRRRIAAGSLPAIKRGRGWWLDRGDVERGRRQPPGHGRALSAEMAWAALLLASGEPERAAVVAGRERYGSRVRVWLREHPLAEHASRLRSRARSEEFDAHPSERARILVRSDVLATGISAGKEAGLVGPSESVEVYAPAGRRAALVAEHGLDPGSGAVRVRWVPDALWPLLVAADGHRAPRAAVLVDLLESDDPRARREAARALGE